MNWEALPITLLSSLSMCANDEGEYLLAPNLLHPSRLITKKKVDSEGGPRLHPINDSNTSVFFFFFLFEVTGKKPDGKAGKGLPFRHRTNRYRFGERRRESVYVTMARKRMKS